MWIAVVALSIIGAWNLWRGSWHMRRREARVSVLYLMGRRYYYLTGNEAVIYGFFQCIGSGALLFGLLLIVLQREPDFGRVLLAGGLIILLAGNIYFSVKRGE